MGNVLMILSLLVAVGCGGGALSGDVPVRLVAHGAVPPEVVARAAAYVDGLTASGYLDPVGRPRLRVTESGERLTVHLWASGTMPDSTEKLGEHRGGRIDVYPPVTEYASSAAFVLAHELVEAIADPDLDGDEIADPCAFDGYALVPIAGTSARVPRYVVDGACWPARSND